MSWDNYDDEDIAVLTLEEQLALGVNSKGEPVGYEDENEEPEYDDETDEDFADKKYVIDHSEDPYFYPEDLEDADITAERVKAEKDKELSRKIARQVNEEKQSTIKLLKEIGVIDENGNLAENKEETEKAL